MRCHDTGGDTWLAHLSEGELESGVWHEKTY